MSLEQPIDGMALTAVAIHALGYFQPLFDQPPAPVATVQAHHAHRIVRFIVEHGEQDGEIALGWGCHGGESATSRRRVSRAK